MRTEEKRIWGIHTQDDNLFLKDNIIAIGWKAMGDLSHIENNREAFKRKYAETYPGKTKQSVANGAGMLYRFCYEVQTGDYIVYPSKSNRMINLGIVDGEYKYENTAREYVQQRKVRWLKHLPRTAFSQGALYEIGSAMSFFTVRNYSDEFIDALTNKSVKPIFASADEENETVAATADDIKEGTRDYILKELSKNLKGYRLEDFIADLLKAMGYRAELSPHGGDSGIDIKAFKDELPPRIVVQVKSQNSDIKEETLQALKGAMSEGDYGLFVTLSNYTKNAQKFLDNTPRIRGIDGPTLADLILIYYEKLSENYRKMIPLEKVYIPVAKNSTVNC
ncbi:MAG: restriction endonuclease [Clostridia bacterium]|nr:restriction endonuclease [Clostridia bacterium]